MLGNKSEDYWFCRYVEVEVDEYTYEVHLTKLRLTAVTLAVASPNEVRVDGEARIQQQKDFEEAFHWHKTGMTKALKADLDEAPLLLQTANQAQNRSPIELRKGSIEWVANINQRYMKFLHFDP